MLKEKKYFQESAIQKALRTFCSATKETRRYIPLSSILNHALKFVGIHKRDFPGLPASLVIKKLVYFRNDPYCLIGSQEHGNLAAKRKPDVVGAREEDMKNRVDGKQLYWTKLGISYELKHTGPITGLLEKRLENDMLLPGSGDGEDKEDEDHEEDEEDAEDAEDSQSEVRPYLYIFCAVLTLLHPPSVFLCRLSSDERRSQQEVDRSSV